MLHWSCIKMRVTVLGDSNIFLIDDSIISPKLILSMLYEDINFRKIIYKQIQVTALGDSKHCLDRLFNEFIQINSFYNKTF